MLAAAALLAGALNSNWTTVLPGRLNHDVGVDRSGALFNWTHLVLLNHDVDVDRRSGALFHRIHLDHVIRCFARWMIVVSSRFLVEVVVD